jgi:hypothetical protein
MHLRELIYCAVLIGIFGVVAKSMPPRLRVLWQKIGARAFQSCASQDVMLDGTGRIHSDDTAGIASNLADPGSVHLR